MTLTICSSELLGIEVDHDRGATRLGALERPLLESLKAMAAQTLSSAPLHLSDSFEPSSKNYPFHPLGAHHSAETVMWWVNAKEILNNEVKRAIEKSAGHRAFRWFSEMNFFACDYMGLHDDQHLHSSFCSGVLLILLHAPHGCNLVTNGNCITPIAPGEVLWMNDTEDHGVFPLVGTMETQVDLHSIAGKSDFLEKDGMTFLLLTCEIPVDDTEELDILSA